MSTPQTTRPTIAAPTPKASTSAGSNSPAPAIAFTEPSGGSLERDQTSPQAIPLSKPEVHAPAGTKTGRDQATVDAHTMSVSAPNFPGDHFQCGTQEVSVAGEHNQPTARQDPTPTDSAPSADNSPPAASCGSPSIPGSPQVGNPLLALAADILDDFEEVRKANANRLRQLTRAEEDADGEERGFGLTLDHPDVARLAAMVRSLLCDDTILTSLGIEKQRKSAGCCLEHDAIRNLERLMKSNPLGPWVKAKAQRGIGMKQAARLIAAIGDPYIRPEIVHEDGTVEPSRPRRVSELWAYCGLHVLPAGHSRRDTHFPDASGNQARNHSDQGGLDYQTRNVGVAPKRQKGQRANWSTVAKTRAYLVATSCLKQPPDTPFRMVYDQTRAKYADAVHKVPCARCGPSGKPAPVGSPLSDGHKHARAMRAVSKEILKELWREAKRLHEGGA